MIMMITLNNDYSDDVDGNDEEEKTRQKKLIYFISFNYKKKKKERKFLIWAHKFKSMINKRGRPISKV